MKLPVQSQEAPIDLPQQNTQGQTETPVGDPALQQGNPDANPFEKERFDAGIDADEDADPKNYIEKLTGKLAQKLRDFNGKDKDVDLNKFVINSLIPAAIPQMGADDAKDVITKVNDNIGKEAENQANVDQPDAIPKEEIPEEPNDVQLESKLANKPKISEDKTIDELVREAIGGNFKTKKSKGLKNPFKAPIFK